MPKAIDTNILVRFLLDDGSEEVPIAHDVFRHEALEISSSVILECEWVLRSIYKVKRDAICEAFTAVLNLENVLVQDENVVLAAVDAHRQGLDFADAMHLFMADKSDEFLTFDTTFRRFANRLADALPVRVPTLHSPERKT
ncbi:MAG: type II toxin-antitoxin system VapC family toxin [Rhizobiaceae bacterium]|nr:type II toxin-antitoxin system VapC family toxin [Rhizobiaceae bacterium]